MNTQPKSKNIFSNLAADIPSSIVVFLVALPLCLGVALASNAPLFSGIIAGVCGGIIVGIASGSQLSVSGPAAGLTAIVASAILTLQSFEAFLVVVVLAGVLQLILGFAKAGIIGDYIPNSVIKGMLAAIGLILIINQVPQLLGDQSALPANDEEAVVPSGNIFINFFKAFAYITPAALVIGLVCLVFHFIWEKWTAGKKGVIRLIPAPLLIVFLGVGLNALFTGTGLMPALSEAYLVNIPQAGSAREFLSFFTSPDWSVIGNSQVWVLALTIALVASLESLLSLEAVDAMDPYQRISPTNRELKAQGIGNIVSGLLGGIPVTSVIVRSSANVNSGAKTKMSAILHGVLLLSCVAFIPALLNSIPKTALAAILIFTGYKLAKPALFKFYYKKGWDQFLPFVITVIAILATDLLKGVIIGIGAGLFFAFRSNFRKAVFVVKDDKKYLFRLRKDVSFLNKALIKQNLEKVPDGAQVVIDALRADFIDKDIVEVIEDFIIQAPLRAIDVQLETSGFIDHGFSNKILANDNKEGHLRRTYTNVIISTRQKEKQEQEKESTMDFATLATQPQ